MRNTIWLWVALLALLFGALATVLLYSDRQVLRPGDEAASAPAAVPATDPVEPAQRGNALTAPLPSARERVPEPEPDADALPLPALDDSDEHIVDTLAELLEADAVARLLIPRSIIRNFVATIDNLPRPQVSERQRPLTAAPGAFMVTGSEDELLLNPQNYDRYTPLVRLFDATESRRLAATYRRIYPLLREAYVELGHPHGNFHQRLLEVIDHLLETPQLRGPIRITRPNVLYEFSDPDLQTLSAGQKTLLRMGPDNTAIVKAKLRELRDELN